MSTVTIRPAVEITELSAVPRVIDPDSEVTAGRVTDVFPQSIASGGPTPNGIILWTRIAPRQYKPSEKLRLEVAADASFDDLVVRAELSGPGVKATDNYTVRVDLAGLLEPDSVYYYRFGYRGVRSRTGRCRTLPAENGAPESLRFGLINCQNYQNGYFGAMATLAETDVDFVLHLGDYIYEHVDERFPNDDNDLFTDRRIDLPDSETLPMSLDDFRRIYETYKTDPHLQRLHERHTVIQTWDDHAIANDRYWDYETDAPVFPEHPCGDVPEFTRYLTRAGIQAWWEFIPSRIAYDPDAAHIHDSFGLYRAVRFGDLVTLLLTDERLFRSRPRSVTEKFQPWRRADSSTTMLGTTQREWFLAELRESDTLWTVWTNSVLFKPLTLGLRWLTPWSDSWDGYDAERRRITETLADVRREGKTAFVTLTGDMHTTLATYLREESDDTPPVGVEFMTPSVTSVNFSEKVETALGGGTGGRLAGRVAAATMGTLVRALNEDYELIDSSHWGYSVIEFSRESCTWDVYWVDKTVDSATAECEPVYRVRVPLEEYAIQRRDEAVPDPSRDR